MKDLFSNQAADYAKYRPTYPQALYDNIYSHVKRFDMAWDSATGNGQAAAALAAKFSKVMATDLSEKQLLQAEFKPNITYTVCLAEKTPFPQHCFDLVTVAQALHWFDFPLFYPELRRVLKPEGIFAAWSYGLPQVTPSVDSVVEHLYQERLLPYWDERRRFIDEEYKTIPFPLKKLAVPELAIELEWTRAHFVNYLGKTWSAVKTCEQKTGINPVGEILPEFESAWGEDRPRTILWPIYLLLGVFE